MNRSSRLLVLAAAVGGVAGCTVSSEPQGGREGATSSVTEAAESQYAGSGTFGVDLSSPANNTALAATGAVYVPLHHGNGTPWLGTDGTPTVAPCGVTFITSHYAVTAAHCVDGTDVPTTSTMFAVQQFDISAVPWTTVQAAGNETDSFFTYSPGYTFAQLTAAQGYKVTQYNQCHVAARCSYGNIACDVSADVALVRCDDRPWFSPALPVAASDAQQGDVSMEWFHEYYNGMPLTQPQYGTTTWSHLFYWHNEDRYQHYTLYPPAAPASEGPDQYMWDQSFHYYGGGRNQLLPMMSMVYKQGDLFYSPRRLGKDPNMDVVWTDLYGCHGTSGSGILQWVSSDGQHYTPQLLGPVSNGSDQSGLGTNLCDTYSGLAGKGQAQLGYPLLRYTQGIAQIAANDWPIIRGFGAVTMSNGKTATPPTIPAPTQDSATHLYAGPPVKSVHMR
jgi:hypothetical protein